MAANLSRYERELDRTRKGVKWKEGQQIVIDSIESKIVRIISTLPSRASEELAEIYDCRLKPNIPRRKKKIRRSDQRQKKTIVQLLVA